MTNLFFLLIGMVIGHTVAHLAERRRQSVARYLDSVADARRNISSSGWFEGSHQQYRDN